MNHQPHPTPLVKCRRTAAGHKLNPDSCGPKSDETNNRPFINALLGIRVLDPIGIQVRYSRSARRAAMIMQ